MIIKNRHRRKGRTISAGLGIGIGVTAIERALGAAPGSLSLLDENVLMAWFVD